MHKAISRALWGAFFVGGLTVLGAGAANAADTTGEDGIASGNQIGILGELPVSISGNAVSILGDSASAGTVSQPTAPSESSAEATTSGQDGALAGNQVMPEATVPVSVAGNAISVLGDSSADTSTPSGSSEDDGAGSDTSAVTSGDDAIAGGNQVMPEATVPILIGGNSISIVGDSASDGTTTSAAATGEGNENDTPASTDGTDGIASGNQVAPDVDAPLVVEGNDIAVIRDDGVERDGLLDGVLGDELLDDGAEDGAVRRLLVADPSFGDGLLQTQAFAESPADAPGADQVQSRQAFNGPLIGDFEFAALVPVEAAVVADEATVEDQATSSGPTALMATAALSPAIVLAATGGDALPLIGGFALLLTTGIALVTAGRMTDAIG